MESSRCRNWSKLGIVGSFRGHPRRGAKEELVKKNWVVVSKIFYFYTYLGKIPILTHIFQRG